MKNTNSDTLIKAGYTVSATLTSTPLWVQKFTEYLQLGVVAVGLAVGLTALYLNLLRIAEKKAKRG